MRHRIALACVRGASVLLAIAVRISVTPLPEVLRDEFDDEMRERLKWHPWTEKGLVC